MRPLLVLTLAATLASAQTRPSTPDTATAEHDRLAAFIGTWSVPQMSAQAYRETCAWLPHGRRHVVCRATWNTPIGPREGLSVMSYDVEKREYLYHGFRPTGRVDVQRGRAIADGLVFESPADAKPRSRVVIRRQADGSMRFLEAIDKGDGKWEAAPEMTYVRVKD